MVVAVLCAGAVVPASVAEALFANSLYEGHILGVARKLISGRKCVISLIAVPTALVRGGAS